MPPRLTPMTDEHAREICTWSYAPPYDIYDMGPWSLVVARGWTLASPDDRRREMRSVLTDDGALIGYVRLWSESERAMLGLGLHPGACGRGLGSPVTTLAIRAHRDATPDVPLWLEVRDWNDRAIRCYERAGFVIVDRVERDPPSGRGVFVVMRQDPDPPPV